MKNSDDTQCLGDFMISGLPIGAAIVARIVNYTGWKTNLFRNEEGYEHVPTFLFERQGKQVLVWVRSYIVGEQDEARFSSDERIKFAEEGVFNGMGSVCIVVALYDIGAKYFVSYDGFEDLIEALGPAVKLDYVWK